MWPGSSLLELQPSVFKILRDLIADRMGLYYDEGKRELLADKLSAHVTEQGLGSFLDYYYLLKYGPDPEKAWSQLVDLLSVQETYFWREIAQVQALVNEILPTYALSFPNRPIRIWCAACATGEEPLTLAIALAEAGWFDRATIEIHASDASPAAVEKARQGLYRERSFRSLPAPLQEKHFRRVPDGWQINAELHSKVTWSVANLLNAAEIAPFAQSPFVFCRNVFIYFSHETVARVLAAFAAGMRRPGYLFVGASESLLRATDDFELQEAGKAFAYVLR